MARGRKPNIDVDAVKLDAAIQNAEGEKFVRTKISEIIMGRDKTYYRHMMDRNKISPEVLKRVCKYYGFNEKDYLLENHVKSEDTQKIAIQPVPVATYIGPDPENSQKMIEILTSIDKTLKDLLAADKATQFILNDIVNNQIKSNSNQKTIIETLEEYTKKRNSHHSSVTKHYNT